MNKFKLEDAVRLTRKTYNSVNGLKKGDTGRITVSDHNNMLVSVTNKNGKKTIINVDGLEYYNPTIDNWKKELEAK